MRARPASRVFDRLPSPPIIFHHPPSPPITPHHPPSPPIRCARLGPLGLEWPCDEAEEALLRPPDALSSALAYLLVPQPNPIVDGMTEEMHCVTWG